MLCCKSKDHLNWHMTECLLLWFWNWSNIICHNCADSLCHIKEATGKIPPKKTSIPDGGQISGALGSSPDFGLFLECLKHWAGAAKVLKKKLWSEETGTQVTMWVCSDKKRKKKKTGPWTQPFDCHRFWRGPIRRRLFFCTSWQRSVGAGSKALAPREPGWKSS